MLSRPLEHRTEGVPMGDSQSDSQADGWQPTSDSDGLGHGSVLVEQMAVGDRG